MTDDIVERLDAWADARTVHAALAREAAAEIRRLRETLRKIDKFIVAITPKPTKEHVAICKEIHHALGSER